MGPHSNKTRPWPPTSTTTTLRPGQPCQHSQSASRPQSQHQSHQQPSTDTHQPAPSSQPSQCQSRWPEGRVPPFMNFIYNQKSVKSLTSHLPDLEKKKMGWGQKKKKKKKKKS